MSSICILLFKHGEICHFIQSNAAFHMAACHYNFQVIAKAKHIRKSKGTSNTSGRTEREALRRMCHVSHPPISNLNLDVPVTFYHSI